MLRSTLWLNTDRLTKVGRVLSKIIDWKRIHLRITRMAHKHINPIGKLECHKISAEDSVDRFYRNILFGGRRVLSCRTDNEFWLLYRSYGAIEGRYPAERAEKWRKDSILYADIPPCHMSSSLQLFLMEKFSALPFLVKNLVEQMFLVENLSALLFLVNYLAEKMFMVENLAWRILQSRCFWWIIFKRCSFWWRILQSRCFWLRIF